MEMQLLLVCDAAMGSGLPHPACLLIYPTSKGMERRNYMMVLHYPVMICGGDGVAHLVQCYGMVQSCGLQARRHSF